MESNYTAGTMTKPLPLVDVRCPRHRRPDPACLLCAVSADISQYYHITGRCIPKLCLWRHMQRHLDDRAAA